MSTTIDTETTFNAISGLIRSVEEDGLPGTLRALREVAAIYKAREPNEDAFTDERTCGVGEDGPLALVDDDGYPATNAEVAAELLSVAAAFEDAT